MPVNLTALAANKWVLYGGAALAALAGYWYFSQPAASSDGALEDEPYGYPATLVPTLAGPLYPAPAAQGSDDGGMSSYLMSLIGLETKKADNDYALGVKSIDATLQMQLFNIGKNFDLGLAEIDASNLATFGTIFETAQKSMGRSGAIAGTFATGEQSFTFNVAKLEATNYGGIRGYRNIYNANPNVGLIGSIAAYNEANADVRFTSSSSGMSFSGATSPTATSGGNSAATPFGAQVAGGQSAVANADSASRAAARAARKQARLARD